MDLVIHGRSFDSSALKHIQDFFCALREHNFVYEISESFASILKNNQIDFSSENIFTNNQTPKKADVALSVGGDGTFLETVGFVAPLDMPIVGVNFGRLGFLTDVQPQNIKQTIKNLSEKKYSVEERLMLKAIADKPFFEIGMNFALNEIAISKTDTSSMIVVHAYVDDEFLNSYWADGLMVSTPTGSTGYNLSCGGPLVLPGSENFVITPICPHNLFVRPIIVSSKSIIKLSVESRSNNFLLSMDSRAKIVGNDIGEIIISQSEFPAKLVKMSGGEFFTVLRKKLKWGEDVRNRR
ncbi:MAG: NAD kinase [Leadbetterella sp.]